MDLTFTTWLWGTKYSEEDVLKLYYGIRRNYGESLRLLVSTDRKLALPAQIEQVPIENPELIGRGCFCRLRMFDPDWQRRNRMQGRIANLDLDAIIVDRVDELFGRSDSFVVLRGVNAVNPNPFNCSVMMLRAGKHAEVWSDFSLAAAQGIRFHEFPDDQGWVWHKLPKAQYWVGGEHSGIYGFNKPGWQKPDHCLPRNAKIIAFIGSKKPSMYSHLPWIRKHWRASL